MAADSSTYDQATIARRQKIAEAMLGDAMKPRKIEHWAQGLAQMGQAGIAGYLSNQANEEAKAEEYKQTADLYKAAGLPPPPAPEAAPSIFNRVASAMSGGGQGTPETAVAAPGPLPSDQASYPPPPAAPPAPTAFRPGITAPQAPVAAAMGGDAGAAIAGIESGGKYDKLGPVTKTGDRAYGKYQVMGANIPQWTKTHLGQEMTPDQFLASPEAQDAVFKGQFGQYAQKYGPEGAAKAWFAGERGMNNPNARDQLGTTVSAYADKFNRAYQPGQQPYEVAGPPTAAPQAPIAQAMAPPQMPAPSGVFANVPKEQLPSILAGLTSKNPTLKAIAVQRLGAYAKNEARDPLDIEAKKLDIETKRKGLTDAPTVQRVKQPDGSEVAVQWDPKAQQWAPLKAPEGGNPVATPKLTEQQSKDVGFYNRGQKLLPRLEQQDKDLTDLASTAGGSVSNYLKTDAFRKAEQTGRELLAVILRKDTGAAVTPQEFTMYGDIYLPKPGDDPDTIQQKREARATAIEGLRMGLGPAEIIFKSREAAEATKGVPAPTSAPATDPPDRASIEAEMRRRGLLK